MRLVMTCPALRQDIGPFEDLSVLTKFALVQQVVRTCFCDCLTKCDDLSCLDWPLLDMQILSCVLPQGRTSYDKSHSNAPRNAR